MTIVSTNSSKEKRSKTNKHTSVDENSPLLPTVKNEDDSVVDEFNGGSSFSGAVFNLSTTIVGAGIMALPAMMKMLGLILGIALIIFMAFLTDASIELLLRFSRRGKSVSYAGVMGDAFGKYGLILLQICVLIKIIGVLIVYMIIIGDVLSGATSNGIHHSGVLEGWFGVHWWNGRTFVLLMTTIIVFAPLASLKRIDSLSYTSALSVALAVVFLGITVAITLYKLIDGTVSMPRMLPDVYGMPSFFKLFTVVPVLVTAYICYYNVHTIDNELEDNTRMKGVVPTALTLCSSIYVLTSVFGFMLFGANFIPSIWDEFQFTGATAAVCIGFIFPAVTTLRDRYGIATKKDKILCTFMIILAVFSNLVAIYSDAYGLFKNPRGGGGVGVGVLGGGG